MKTRRLRALAVAATSAASLKYYATARRLASLVFFAGTFILFALPEPLLGNIFITDPFNNGTIGKYTNSGAPIDASLITGLSDPRSIAVYDGFLYVTNPSAGTVGKYTTSGETINASLISGLSFPQDIEVSGGNLYVSDFENSLTGVGRVGKYTTSGAAVDASLVTGILGPYGLAISGTNLFVSNGATIDKYTTSGILVKPSLITDELGAHDVEVFGSSLFVSYFFGEDPLVGKYHIDGTAIDPRLIFRTSAGVEGLAVSGTELFVAGESLGKYTTSGVIIADPLRRVQGFPVGIAIGGPAIPEPLSLWFVLIGGAVLGFARRLRMLHWR